MNNGNIDIGKKIRELRIRNSLRQNDLANIIGVTNSTMSNYERNNSTPSNDTLKDIANFFNVSMDYLFDHHVINNETLSINKNQNYNIPNPISNKDEYKVIKYFQRLNDENKDYIKGKMVDLYKEQIEANSDNKKITL